MQYPERWIWLDELRDPRHQTTVYSAFTNRHGGNYTVAEFQRTYRFPQKVIRMHLHVSGDTEFCLFVNGQPAVTGPANVGGDFLGNDFPRPAHYATELTVMPRSDTVELFARVKMMPVGINEYSQGHGGFMLAALATMEDGSQQILTTDETWEARRNDAYASPYHYDGSSLPNSFGPAQVIPDIWHCRLSPLPPRAEEVCTPVGGGLVRLAPAQSVKLSLPLEKIYAGFLSVKAETKGILEAEIRCTETGEEGTKEFFYFDHDEIYRGLQLHSAGSLEVKATNYSPKPATLEIAFINTFLSADPCAHTVTSDEELNRVLETCVHTLKQCRQMMHLDSPRHGEPLACTGDYYIESLMTAFSIGDMTLAAFDVRRTAELLRQNDGRMFHTSYSLIWVRMLWDIYLFTGEKALLEDCVDALLLLLHRFEGYIGTTGLVETPPDYMFVDWIEVDGISLHHPPKALGQSCLNLFYLDALHAAESVFSALGVPAMAQRCRGEAQQLREAINRQLYDPLRGLYCEGLNTPTPPELIGQYMPANVDKKYFRCHANILAACFGAAEKPASLLRKLMLNPTLGNCQPYFAHFLLEAIRRAGMAEEYTLKVLEQWKAPVAACDKGLVEGFIAPESTYVFDHSHAWGGTPVYALPMALLGLEILEPGMRRLRLAPRLLPGLTHARVELPTPLGLLVCTLEAGKAPVLEVPAGIETVTE